MIKLLKHNITGLLIKIFFSICFLILIYYKFNINVDTKLFAELLFYHYVLYFFLTLSIIFVKAYKWHFLLKATHSNTTPFFIDFQAILVGVVVGSLTPATTGDIFRNIYYDYKLKYVFLTGIDKLFDLFSLILLVCSSLFFFQYYWLTLFLVLSVAIILFISRFALTLIPLQHISFYKRTIHERIIQIKAILSHIQRKNIFAIIVLGLTYWLLTVCRVAFLFFSIFGVFNIKLVLSIPIIMFVSMIPISIGGLGIREGFGSYFLWNNLGIPMSNSFNVFIINFILLYIVQLLLFLIVKLMKPKSRHKQETLHVR